LINGHRSRELAHVANRRLAGFGSQLPHTLQAPLNLRPGHVSQVLLAYFNLEEAVLLNENGDTIVEKIPELKSLSPEEKLILVGELWEELAARPDAFPPRDDHIQLLKERLDHYRQHPEDAVAWEQVKERILGSR